jgi:DNA-binding GntR family transcriptional regulator
LPEYLYGSLQKWCEESARPSPEQFARLSVVARGLDMVNSSNLVRRAQILRLFDLLTERIVSGSWQPGFTLPNERELAREYGVSPDAVREALCRLQDGWLVRRCSSQGTLVVEALPGQHSMRLNDVSGHAGKRVDNISEVLSQTVGRPSEDEQRELRLPPEEGVLRTRRLRKQHGAPFMYEEACLTMNRFPGLRSGEAGDYDILNLAWRHGLHLPRASEKVWLAEASPEIVALLEVDADTALLRLERVIFAAGGDPIERRIGFCHLAGESTIAERH